MVDKSAPEFPVCEGRVEPCRVHWFADVQMYQFCPASEVVRIKVAPTWQVAGNTAPVCEGSVELAAEKLTLLVCVRRSICVCAHPAPASATATGA